MFRYVKFIVIGPLVLIAWGSLLAPYSQAATRVLRPHYKILDKSRAIACFPSSEKAQLGVIKTRTRVSATIAELSRAQKKSLGKKRIARLKQRCNAWAREMSFSLPSPTPSTIPPTSTPSVTQTPQPTPTRQITPRPSADDCTHFASPNGSGNGFSQNMPFHIADFWNLAEPGDVLCLLDGEYTGVGNLISPPEGISGVPGNPITVKAFNDGKASINGQGQYQPIALYRNDWMVLEGFNAHSSNYHVIGIAESNHTIVRRVVMWDAKGNNSAVAQIAHSEFTLIEDSAFFGYGHYSVSTSQHGDHTTIRRVWARFEGVDGPNGISTFSLGYNSYHNTAENIIGTWDNVLTPPVQNPHCIIGATSENETGTNKKAYTKVLGSLAYTTPNQHVDEFASGLLFGGNAAELTVQDTVSIMNNSANLPPASFYTFPYWSYNQAYTTNSTSGGNISAVIGSRGGTLPNNGHYYLVLSPGVSSATIEPNWPTDGSIFTDGTVVWMDAGPVNNFINNVTTIGISSSILRDWNVSGYTSGTTISNAYPGTNPFNASIGANLCYRYVDGVMTGEPLWPWPMNQRIIDAITNANQITPQFNREVTDVTKTVAELLGPIPAECCDESLGNCE